MIDVNFLALFAFGIFYCVTLEFDSYAVHF